MEYELKTLIRALDGYSRILLPNAENGEVEIDANITNILGMSIERANQYPFIEKGSKKEILQFLLKCIEQIVDEKEIEDME